MASAALRVDPVALLRRVGVSSPLSDADVAAIMSVASSASTPSSGSISSASASSGIEAHGQAYGDRSRSAAARARVETPSTADLSLDEGGAATPAAARRRHNLESSALSLPSELLAELASPEAAERPTTHTHARAPGGATLLTTLGDSLRQEYESRILRLSEQADALAHERRLMEVEHARRVRQLTGELQNAREEAQTTVQAARSAQNAAESAAAAMREQLAASKAHFTGELVISHAMYEELRRLPHEALSLRQYVQMRIHETLAPMHTAMEALRQDGERAQAEARARIEELERRARDAVHRASVAEARSMGLQEHVSLHESTIQRLQARLHDALAQVESLHGKGTAFDSIEHKRRELEVVHEKDVQVLAAQTSAMEVAKADRDAAVARAADLQLKVELLTADKATLSTSLEEARTQAHRLQDQLDACEQRMHDAARQRDAYQQQVVHVAGETRSAAEERMQVEIQRLRENNARELDQIRAASKEAYERELLTLRDARAEAVADAARLSTRLDSVQRALDDANRRVAVVAAEAEAGAAGLRGLLKAKTFEAERMALTHAEAVDSVKRLTDDNNNLREKVVELQATVARVQAEAEAQRVTLQTALTAEQDKLAVYDRLEVELDNAVLAAADSGVADVTGVLPTTLPAASGAPGTSLQMTLAAGVPTTARRRLRQTILLAKELNAAQKEATGLRRRLDATERALEDARTQGAEAREQLEALSGPHAYFINTIRDKEKQVSALRQDNTDLRRQLSETRQALTRLDAARTAAEADLKRVLTTRSDVHALTELVHKALKYRATAQLTSLDAHADVNVSRRSVPVSAGLATGDLAVPHVTPAASAAPSGSSRSTPPHAALPAAGGARRAPAASALDLEDSSEQAFASEAPTDRPIEYHAPSRTSSPSRASSLASASASPTVAVTAVDRVTAGGSPAPVAVGVQVRKIDPRRTGAPADTQTPRWYRHHATAS